MADLQQLLDDAVARQDVPFVVAMVTDRNGTLWSGASGAANAMSSAGPDTMFHIASQTKAIGALAVLLLVDRGRLTLDTEIGAVLPEFGDRQVLETIGPTGPVYRAPKRPITLRHLLTHTAGLAYPGNSDKQLLWQMLTGAPDIISGKRAALQVPLIFDPGEGFEYGIGYDWLGPLIEQVDGRRTDTYCQEEIFAPLGMTTTSFTFTGDRDRLAGAKFRTSTGDMYDFPFAFPQDPEFLGLGGALLGTPDDYLRFLRFVLNRGELDGRRLLSEATFDLMVHNQMGDLRMGPVQPTMSIMGYPDYFPATEKTWSAGFVRFEQDVPGMRRAGSLSWSGFLNSHYWIDPASEVAAVYMTQLLPFCHPDLMNAFADFERGVYTQLDSLKAHAQPA